MKAVALRVVFLLLTFFSFFFLSAQDSVVYKWNATAKKISDNKYELSFKTDGIKGWQLYSSAQTIPDFATTELRFEDSSVIADKKFSETGTVMAATSTVFTDGKVNVYEGNTEWKNIITINGVIPAKLKGVLQYSYGRAAEFLTADFPFSVELEGGVDNTAQVKVSAIDLKNPVNPCGDDGTENKSILTVFLLGLLGGLVALLTPCVFPMIPVTVTFFTKRSGDKASGRKNAILYGLFIFFIYVAITIPFHIAGNTRSEVFNNISTNVWLNLVFFAVFVIFALSFFGLFEITLPSSFANKADSKAGIGNIAGIFFMAGTLAIVSFSCTGPILGTLLAGVADQGAWPLTAGAAGFGLALGLPFALFAMFPDWLKSLPKSGGWMTSVKVVLGFIELALAMKFLANADNVEQWGIMKREVFVASWIIIGTALTLYLLGILKFKKESQPVKFTTARIFFITIFAAITIYLIPGLFNSTWASMKLLSGFPPPLSYSVYGKHHVLYARNVKPIENDYNRALQLAKDSGKPILIDFTGWACVNCRRMEEKVWTNKEVDSLMQKEFIVVSLYVDERRKLPLSEQTTYKTPAGVEESIVTIGDKWSAFQKVNFGAVSQPQYAILNADQKVLTKTKFYTPDADEFADWLKCGLDASKKSSGK